VNSNAPTSTQKYVARIQQDIVIQNIFKRIASVQINKKMSNELMSYFITSRDLASPGHYDYGVNVKFINPGNDIRNCLGAMMKIQGYRDRVCEIQVNLLEAKRILKSGLALGTRHVYEMYAVEVKSRGVGEYQKAFIATIFSPLQSRLNIVDTQLDQVEAILQNLDKAHFAYRSVAEIGSKLVDRMEGGRSVISARA